MNEEKPRYLLLIAGIFLYVLASVWALVPIVKLYYRYKGYLGGKLPNTSDIWVMYRNPLSCYATLSDSKILTGWVLLIITITLFGIILIYILRNVEVSQTGIQYLSENGTQGTATWMGLNDAKQVLGVGTNKGLIFGIMDKKMITLPKESFLNRHVAVFGASGSMKSRSYVRTNVLQMAEEGHSMICTDPKGELYRDMAEYLRDKGYEVRLFNLVNMINSDRWNPLSEVKDDIDAQMAAEVIIANTQLAGKKAGGDPFWDRAEQNLLKALILYVIKEYDKEEDKNLPTVYQLLASGDAKKLQATFDMLSNSHPAKMPYNIYAQASETVRTGVVIGLGTRLQVFQNKLVQELTRVSDIDLTLPGRKKSAYFCVISDTDSTFDFLAGLYFSFLFIKLTRYADQNNGRCDKDVYFILDEFPNIAAIPDFTKKISTMRSRGLHSSVIFQNISQLKNRYPMDAWQEIIGNCDSRLFLGCTDIATAQFVSDLLGTSTVKNVSTRKQAGLEGIFDFGSVTTASTQRNLMNPDEILRLESKNAILILRGQKPILLEKMDYTKHKSSKQMNPIPINKYVPEWASKLNNTPKKESTEKQEPVKEEMISSPKVEENTKKNDISETVFYIKDKKDKNEPVSADNAAANNSQLKKINNSQNNTIEKVKEDIVKEKEKEMHNVKQQTQQVPKKAQPKLPEGDFWS